MTLCTQSINWNRRAPALLFLLVSVVLLLQGCGSDPLQSIFITPAETGLSQPTLKAILTAQEKLRANPDDEKLPYGLAYSYLQAVRESADTAYYGRVESLLAFSSRRHGTGPEDEFLRGLIHMGKHDFPKALLSGEKLVNDYPEVQRYYGLLADAQVELGLYDKAISTLQAMADIDPDSNVLTRIAYVREIHGDLQGAREAMEQALDGQRGGENMAWGYSELARLWIASEPSKAYTLYEKALAMYPDFPPALAGMARVAMALGHPDEALTYAEKAASLLPIPEYPALVGDIHHTLGNEQKAGLQYQLVKIGYQQIAAAGTNVKLEQTRFLLEHDLSLDDALLEARSVYAGQPTIYAADVLALALLKKENHAEAWEYAQKALATGSHDPFILFHAALIAEANGNRADAKKYAGIVQKESPYFSFVHTKELAVLIQRVR